MYYLGVRVLEVIQAEFDDDMAAQEERRRGRS
jgi:hypothetical protein